MLVFGGVREIPPKKWPPTAATGYIKFVSLPPNKWVPFQQSIASSIGPSPPKKTWDHSIPIGSMGLVYLPTWMAKIYGKCRQIFQFPWIRSGDCIHLSIHLTWEIGFVAKHSLRCRSPKAQDTTPLREKVTVKDLRRLRSELGLFFCGGVGEGKWGLLGLGGRFGIVFFWGEVGLNYIYTPRKFSITPERWWLEDDPFLLGPGHSSGAILVQLREG